MKSSHSPSRLLAGSLEILEARIAPASVIRVGPTDLQGGNLVHYDTVAPAGSHSLFIDTVKGEAASDPISLAVGSYSDPASQSYHDETFYIKLSAGDVIQIVSQGGQTNNLLQVRAGTAVAFFEDLNHDDKISSNELVSLSLGTGAAVSVQTSLSGSIVSDLTSKGNVELTDLVSTHQTITGVAMGGFNVNQVLAGGNISNVNTGHLAGIFAGTAALGKTVTFFPDLQGMGTVKTGTITSLTSAPGVTLPSPGQVGASIINFSAQQVGTVQAGNGGVGGAGGSLTLIQIDQETSSFNLLAGDGGNADSTLHQPNGGAGGNVSSVYIAGFTDTTPNSLIKIHAGVGGAASATVGAGGHGGSVQTVFIGSTLNNGVPTVSLDFVQDDLSIAAGDGGAGKSGGTGGSLNTMRVITNTPVDTAAELMTYGLAHEIVLQAGAGGASLATTGKTSHGGTGGGITDAQVVDQAPQAVPFMAVAGATVALVAGDGGQVSTNAGAHVATGAAGGSIFGARLLGPNLIVQAGNGSDGTTGGAGGGLTGIRVLQQGTIFSHDLSAEAGRGGNATAGSGGAGGAINGLTSVDGDFIALNINAAGGGAGGASDSGLGGRGGAVSNFDLLESNSQRDVVPLFGNFVLRSGTGGPGKTGGGAGGLISAGSFEGENMNVSVTSGNGGQAVTSGNGGRGGAIAGLRINVDGNVANATAATAVVTSGSGGTGALNGGAGGNVAGALVRVFDNLGLASDNPPLAGGDVTLIAGPGGSGDTGNTGLRGLPGAGGSVFTSGVYSQLGSGVLRAGDAGSGGTGPAAGGSIVGGSANSLTGLYAAQNLTIAAGAGSQGGVGGGLSLVGYGAPTEDLLPVPTGNIIITAGDGSARHASVTGRPDYAGAGGSINALFGSVSGTAGTVTAIHAGHGGEVAGGTKAGAGGSITGLTLQRGPVNGVPGGVVTIDAGDAGGTTLGVQMAVPVGARGGSVSNVIVRANVGDGTLLRSVAAGDGGPGTKTGGAGGSVTNVQAESHDIGVRTGVPFGYSTMGGVFAGKGGDGGTKNGIAGNVTTISADSISSIVAGKFLSGPRQGQFDLVNTVSNIKLNSTHELAPTLGTAFTDSFEFAFHPVLFQTTANDGSQTFERIPGGSSSAQQPPGGPSTFTLTYHLSPTQSETTVPLDADASAQQIMAALNALPDSPNATVTTDPADPVHFTVQYANESNSPLTGLGTENTVPLHGNSRPRDVQAALNQLSASVPADPNYPNYQAFPGATVVSSDNASFNVTYAANGTPGDLTAERILTDRATAVAVPGDATHPSLQHLQLLGTGQFRVHLNTGGGNFVSTHRLNENATPQEVQRAINNQLGAGTVTVSAGDQPNSYDILFANNGAQPPVEALEYADLQGKTTTAGTAMQAEVQSFNFTSLYGANDLVFTVNGDTVHPVSVPADHTTSEPPTAQQVQDALNGNSVIQGKGGVTVTLLPTNTFEIHFNTPGNAVPITAVELLPAQAGPVMPVITNPVQVTDSSNNDGVTPDVQTFQPDAAADFFNVGFSDTAQSVNLANHSPASAVQSALQSLADGSPAGSPEHGATIAVDLSNGAYTVTITSANHQQPLNVTESFDASQKIGVSNQGTFHLDTANGSTSELSPNARAADVAAAINAVPGNPPVSVTNVPGEHGVFIIKYLDGQNDPAVKVVDTQALAAADPNSSTVDLTYARQVTFDPNLYASANVLGAIVQINKLSSDIFAYTDLNGDHQFDLGDHPIDGLVAAKNFSQQSVNTTPQARLVINSDVNSAPGVYKPVDPANPTVPQFFDFRNDNIA